MMKSYTAIVEKDLETGLYVSYVPGIPGARTHSKTLEGLRVSLRDVMSKLAKDREPHVRTKFVGTQKIVVS